MYFTNRLPHMHTRHESPSPAELNGIPLHSLEGTIQRVNYRRRELRVIAEGRDPGKVQMRECMTGSPVFCRLEDDVHVALDLMKEHHIRRVPVVDEEQRICGMISFANLVANHADPDQVFEMLRAVSVPTPEAILVRHA